jgi:hypothetical protein
MIRVKITDKVGNQFSQDMENSEVDAYKQLLAEKQLFGKPSWSESLINEDGSTSIVDHPAEYTLEEEDITERFQYAKDKEEALKLLADTDWYIIRELDSGVPCPPDIKAARQAAREKI